MENDVRMAYITTENKEEARMIGKDLVENHLAACVNIIDGMESMFWWKGEIDSDNETILIAKTVVDLVPKLTERVKELHSYETPCVITLPIQAGEGNPAYLQWLREEVKPALES